MELSKNRYAYLDALRGLAVLSVFIFHTSGYLSNSSNDNLSEFLRPLVTSFVDWGRFGVVLFFLISGFIIPQSLNKSSNLITFMVNRFFRLYPVFWFSFLVVIFATEWLNPGYYFGAKQLLANATMAPKIFGVTEISGVYWTLFVEVLFYFSCAFLFKFKLLESPWVIGFMAICLNLTTSMAVAANHLFTLNLPIQFLLFHLSFLFIGSLLRMVVLDANKLAFKLSLLFIPIVIFNCALVSGCFFYVEEAVKANFTVLSPLATLNSYLFAFSIFIFSVGRSIFADAKLLIEIGKVSYSVYLLHMSCILLLANYFEPSLSSMHYLKFLLVAILVTYLVSKLSFTFIEISSVKLGKRIVKNFGLQN